MAKRIEIRNKATERLMATYFWESKEFRYDPVFYAKNGDWLHVTRGPESKTFETIPDYLFEFFPEIGSSNYHRIIRKYNIDPDDLFSFFTRLGNNPPASYYFKGVRNEKAY